MLGISYNTPTTYSAAKISAYLLVGKIKKILVDKKQIEQFITEKVLHKVDIFDQKNQFQSNVTAVRTAKRHFGPPIATRMEMDSTMRAKFLNPSPLTSVKQLTT